MDRHGLWYATALCQHLSGAECCCWLRASEELDEIETWDLLIKSFTVYSLFTVKDSSVNRLCTRKVYIEVSSVGRGPKHVDLFGSSAMNKSSYDPF